MDYDQIMAYFMAKEGAVLTHPYGDKADVFKVGGRKFGVLATDGVNVNIYVKCHPDEALALRDIYHSIVPGYKFDQKHWNTLIIDGRLPVELIKEQIDQSYGIVMSSVAVLNPA